MEILPLPENLETEKIVQIRVLEFCDAAARILEREIPKNEIKKKILSDQKLQILRTEILQNLEKIAPEKNADLQKYLELFFLEFDNLYFYDEIWRKIFRINWENFGPKK